MKRFFISCLSLCLTCISATQSLAQFQNGDILIGKSTLSDTLALVRGGSIIADPFSQAFIAGMDFDNTGGINNNAAGNLVMINRGAIDGSVYIGATDGSGTTTLVGDFLGGFPAFNTILNGRTTYDLFEQVAVSPDNSKIAISTAGQLDTNGTAAGAGALLLFDYDPSQVGVDNTMVLTNGRALEQFWYAFGLSDIEWMDNDTLVLSDGDSGFLDTIDLDVNGNLDAGSRTRRRNLLGPGGGEQPLDSDSDPVVYNPTISPYVFVGGGDFNSGAPTSPVDLRGSNYIWVLDPTQTEINGDWKLVARARYDDALDQGLTAETTIRDMELLDNGDLAIVTFSGSLYTLDLSTLDGSACGDPANFDLPDGGCGGLSDDTGVTLILDGDVEFDGDNDMDSDNPFALMTIARTAPATPPGDFDGDGDADGHDFLIWQRGNSPSGPLDAGDLVAWQGAYGNPLTAAVGAVPEPATLALLGLALVPFACGRNR